MQGVEGKKTEMIKKKKEVRTGQFERFDREPATKPDQVSNRIGHASEPVKIGSTRPVIIRTDDLAGFDDPDRVIRVSAQPNKIQPGPTQDPPSPALIHPSRQKLTLASLPFCPKPFAAQAPPQPPRAAISPLGHYPSCRAAGRRLSLSLGPLFLAHTRRGSHSLPRRPSQSLSFPRRLASLPRRPHCCCFCPHSPSHCPPSPSLCCCFCPPSASAVAASATVPPPPLQLLLPPRPRSASGCCWFFWFRVRLLLVLLEFWSGPAAASSRFKEIQAMDFGGIGDEEEEEFEFSRNYFLAKELGSSAKKSTHKLTDIDVVDEQELREASLHIQPKHENEIALLMDSYKTMYPEWVLALRSGFGLLMYGFGSKKALIEDFASTALTEYSVVVINGYLQAINLKQVLIALVEVLYDQLKTKRRASSRDLPKNTQSMEDLLTFLDEAEIEETDFFVCVVINNLDGPGLRDFETQQYLARLAACSHIRIVASIDHVNAPLYWDKNMAHTQFNWCWYHVPTFAPYKVEGMFYPLILAHGGANQNVKTATIVLQSLTPNAQSVFKVLAEHQLSHPEEGMPISDLYSVCRERFLVSSQVTLNSHLTEFKDHELVKIKKNSDGQECLFIPLSAEALQKVLQEIS